MTLTTDLDEDSEGGPRTLVGKKISSVVQLTRKQPIPLVALVLETHRIRLQFRRQPMYLGFGRGGEKKIVPDPSQRVTRVV